MKFEKLNDNKIRITLSITDLVEKNIDFHMFMSNSIESQDILVNMLEEAKKETGFDPENYNLKIEALSMADTYFVFTITKVIPEIDVSKNSLKSPTKKFAAKIKNITPSCNQSIYCFNCFEDFCSFINFINKNNYANDIYNIAYSITLYSYKQNYYLLLQNINQEVVNKIKFYTIISEFAKYIVNSNIFSGKLKECGTLFINHNAFKIANKYFIT